MRIKICPPGHDVEDDALLEKLGLTFIKDWKVYDHDSGQWLKPKHFAFSELFPHDKLCYEARANHPVTSEATEEEIQEWAKIDKSLDWMDDPVAYAAARKKLQFVEYDPDTDRDVPTLDPIDTSRAQYAEDPWAFFGK